MSNLEQRLTDFLNGNSPLPTGKAWQALLSEMVEAIRGMRLEDPRALFWLGVFRALDAQRNGWMNDFVAVQDAR